MPHPFDITNPQVARVLAIVRRRNRSAWVVGGFVRDRLLGRTSHDLDLVVPEGAIGLARAIAGAEGGGFFVLDAERDVARAILRQGAGPLLNVDVARLRAADLADDLAYRDYTINAIALEVGGDSDRQRLVDPFHGRRDLEQRTIRVVSEGAFVDDPLRMLRGVRLAAELSFRLQEATIGLIRRDAPRLAGVAAERVRDELVRIIGARGAWRQVRLLQNLELLPVVLPEAATLVGVEQSPPHYLDVFDHSRAVLAHAEGVLALLWPEGPYAAPESAPDDPVVIAGPGRWHELAEALVPYAAALRDQLLLPLATGRLRRDAFLWAALAHDWGKALTQSVDETGRVRFFEHEHRGAALVTERLRALAFAADEIGYVARLVDQHMRPGFLAGTYPPTPRAVYRFFRDAGAAGPDTVLLSLADKMATRAPNSDPRPAGWPDMLATAGQMWPAYFAHYAERVNPRPLLDGRQIMAEFAIPQGPEVGRLLERLREAQAVGKVTNVEQARAYLARLLRANKDRAGDAQGRDRSR